MENTMSGISSIGSTTPTQNQILEAALHTHLLHKHTPHPTASVATQTTQSAGNDSGSTSASSNATPTSSEILEVILNGHTPSPSAPVAGQANPPTNNTDGAEINEMA
jgi:hypothetical protein